MTTMKEQIKKLATISLVSKWNQKQSKNSRIPNEPCPFCDYAFKQLKEMMGKIISEHGHIREFEDPENCDFCLCPKILCHGRGHKGLIGVFEKNVLFKEQNKELYDLMVKSLIILVKKGCLNSEIRKEIKEMIKRWKPKKN